MILHNRLRSAIACVAGILATYAPWGPAPFPHADTLLRAALALAAVLLVRGGAADARAAHALAATSATGVLAWIAIAGPAWGAGVALVACLLATLASAPAAASARSARRRGVQGAGFWTNASQN